MVVKELLLEDPEEVQDTKVQVVVVMQVVLVPQKVLMVVRPEVAVMLAQAEEAEVQMVLQVLLEALELALAAEAVEVQYSPARLGRSPPAADGVIPLPREVAEQLSRRSPRGSPPQPPPPTAGGADSAVAMRSWRGLSVNVAPSLVVKPETVVSL